MPLRFVFAVHNHQPVGNFDSVFEQAYRDGYAPFLELMSRYPEIPFTLHTSGCLLDWLQVHHPEYVEELRRLVQRGQVEILGGAFYEPILSMLPAWDRQGQIRSYRRHLEQLFGCRVRGMWLAERVWEPDHARDLAAAGVEYTLLDDYHFRQAGVDEDQLFGWYLTEDQGLLLKVWPISEPMRYLVPWKSPEEAIAYLREVRQRHGDAVVVCADDGEKFGVWPETHRHCYQDGWLYRFFDLLRANQSWIRACTLSQALDETSARGLVYLPDCSYREMTEWALPARRLYAYTEVVREFEHDPRWGRLRPFLRGGFWRNFRAKYPEVREMYCRMLEISRRLHDLEQQQAESPALETARKHLYQAQCNCPYWHGAFGGLYLPHLRHAVYAHLLRAENALRQAEPQPAPVQVRVEDFDLDTKPEIKLANDALVAYLAPGRGGILYEWDVRGVHHNLLATLSRRYEAYHETIKKVAQGGQAESAVSKVVEGARFKQAGLEQLLHYDRYLRKSLVDHFLDPQITLAHWLKNEVEEQGSFVESPYEFQVEESADRASVTLWRRAAVAGTEVELAKSVTLLKDSAGLYCRYRLSRLPADRRLRFAVEFQFAGLAPGQEDRYFHYDGVAKAGQLQTHQDVGPVRCFGLTDEWLGLDVALCFSLPTSVWAFPVHTVSQSEGGFELVQQSVCVVPHWLVPAPGQQGWEVAIELRVSLRKQEAGRR
jgi:alpha-amylase